MELRPSYEPVAIVFAGGAADGVWGDAQAERGAGAIRAALKWKTPYVNGPSPGRFDATLFPGFTLE
jgi:hypothetical protein